MRRMNTEEALAFLAQHEPRTDTELPRFITAPRYLEHGCNGDGSVTIYFECRDEANDRSWAVPVVHRPAHRTEPLEYYAQALETANKIARAVFN